MTTDLILHLDLSVICLRNHFHLCGFFFFFGLQLLTLHPNYWIVITLVSNYP